MTIVTTIKIDEGDLNMLYNLLGQAHRAPDQAAYEKTIPFVRETVQRLAERAFQAGREFERKNLG